MSPLHRIIRQYGPYRIPLGPAKLYLDDIQDIVSTVETFAVEHAKRKATETEGPTENPGPGSVMIVATDTVADSVDDLKEASKEDLKHLYISLDTAKLFVDLSHIGSDISVPRDDSDARALGEDLAKFINSKRMRSASLWFLRGGALYFLIGAIVNVSLGIYAIAHRQPYFPPFATAVFNIAFIMALRTFVAPSSLNEVKVVPVKRSESRRLSSSTRREIVIAVIASAIGAAIVSVFTLWAGVFAK